LSSDVLLEDGHRQLANITYKDVGLRMVEGIGQPCMGMEFDCSDDVDAHRLQTLSETSGASKEIDRGRRHRDDSRPSGRRRAP
jgi:hypothetical protein